MRDPKFPPPKPNQRELNKRFIKSHIPALYDYIAANPTKRQRIRAWLAQYFDDAKVTREITIKLGNQFYGHLRIYTESKGGGVAFVKIEKTRDSAAYWSIRYAPIIEKTHRRSWSRDFKPYVQPKTVIRADGAYALDRSQFRNDYARSF